MRGADVWSISRRGEVRYSVQLKPPDDSEIVVQARHAAIPHNRVALTSRRFS